MNANYEPVVLELLSQIYIALGSSNNITGLISSGTNITITGTGTTLDPYVISSNGGGGASITVVANYSALPAPGTVTGLFYWVSNSQGTSWLPGSLGGTFYNSGIYYSNGITWEFLKTPYQATQAEVNTGTNTDKFVTPDTLTNSTVITNKVLSNTTITGATKTKITYDSKGLITSGEDATTVDISDSTNKRYQTDNQQTFNDATSSIQGQLDNKQPLDGDLTAIAALTTDGFLKRTGVNNWVIVSDAVNTLTSNVVLNFGNEQEKAITTISTALITSTNLKSITLIPIETSETSIDDFLLTGVILIVSNIIDNTSFDVVAYTPHNASGNHTVKYILTY